MTIMMASDMETDSIIYRLIFQTPKLLAFIVFCPT